MPKIEEIKLSTWEEFKNTLLEDTAFLEKKKKEKDARHISDMLYRGHTDSDWLLTTTLERFTKNKKINWRDYHGILELIEPSIFSFTENKYALQEFNDKDECRYNSVPPAYDFMVYLRHHGFPSPS